MRFWYHPESDCIFEAEEPLSEECEELTQEEYAEMCRIQLKRECDESR